MLPHQRIAINLGGKTRGSVLRFSTHASPDEPWQRSQRIVVRSFESRVESLMKLKATLTILSALRTHVLRLSNHGRSLIPFASYAP